MAPLSGPQNWPPAGPMFEDTKGKDYTGGHPTVPGDLDPYEPRRQPNVELTGEVSPGGGRPGVPRYKSLGPRHGPGIPGPTTSGPTVPGVDYDDGGQK